MSTTWANTYNRGVKATCTSGTELAPSGATAGFDLQLATGFAVFVESAATAFTAGKLLAYLYNPISGAWSAAPDLDLTVAAVVSQGFSGFRVPCNSGRIAFVPSGLGQACTVYINGGV